MSNILQYKGYSTRIEVSVEDQILYGKIEGIADLVNFEAESFEDIENEFHAAVDDYLDFCESIGKKPDREFKGSINIRIDPKTHRDLFMLSVKHNTSLNQVIQSACRSYCDQEQLKESFADSVERFALARSAIAIAQTMTLGAYTSSHSVSSSHPATIH